MSNFSHKKSIERWFLEAARVASTVIPDGEIEDFEKPDFQVHTAHGTLGIEVTELLRQGTGTDRPVKQDSIREKAIRAAEEEYYRTPDSMPVRVTVYFRREADTIRIRQVARELTDFVKLHAVQATPAVVFSERQDLPEAFSAITIDSNSGPWFHGTAFTITIPEIYEQLASRIRAKNKLLPVYRTRMPNTPMWLLVCSSFAASRGVPIPHGADEWKFPFNFEKVLFFSCLSPRVVEILRE